MEKKLTRSNNRKMAGVCAGIAEYLDIDPTVIRALWAFISIFFWLLPGIILYIVLAIIMPVEE
ncbi:MAG: PspC domain-containing protein [Prevotella sp.]|nr:PspC domain-containing protein [Prevotella sp.]